MALARTDVLEEKFVSIIRVEEINKLGTTLAVTSNCSLNLSTLMMEVTYSSETALLT
jgi:hypothetical protein